MGMFQTFTFIISLNPCGSVQFLALLASEEPCPEELTLLHSALDPEHFLSRDGFLTHRAASRKHLKMVAGVTSRVLGSQLTQSRNRPGETEGHELRIGHRAQRELRNLTVDEAWRCHLQLHHKAHCLDAAHLFAATCPAPYSGPSWIPGTVTPSP